MIIHLIKLYHYRDFLWLWTKRELSIRYKQAFLGVVWALLQPLALMLLFTVVFSRFVKVPTDGIPYPIFSYAAILPWTLLATSITSGTSVLVNNMALVSKIYFPREVLCIASIQAALVDFFIASSMLVALLLHYRVPVCSTLLAIPLLVLVQLVLISGVVFWGATAMVFFRDVRFVIPLCIQIWMYATPVIYPLSIVPPEWLAFYKLNPMVALIDGYRSVIAYGRWPDWTNLAFSTILAILIMASGYWVLKRNERYFADVI